MGWPSAAQQGTATLEFTVQAAPTGGRAEKVMRHPFYLLRVNLETIEQLAREQSAPPDLAAFIEEQPVSPELKEWMKEHETVKLRGEDFPALLTVDDVLDIPEFRHAYVTANQIMVGLGFPKRKVKLTDRTKKPEKWEADDKRYWEEVRSYLILHPESKRGMDQHLLDINATPEWNARQKRHQQEVQRRALQLAHTPRFLVAHTETNYQGFARLRDLPPGRYWLTNLWNEVRAGDVHLRWELLVELQAGQRLYLELNNANARYDPPGF
ncbi:MAG: hypothetical protein V3U28_01625 [Candidatus Acidoferrales bacterium]